jgi:hypothetical protein
MSEVFFDEHRARVTDGPIDVGSVGHDRRSDSSSDGGLSEPGGQMRPCAVLVTSDEKSMHARTIEAATMAVLTLDAEAVACSRDLRTLLARASRPMQVHDVWIVPKRSTVQCRLDAGP